MKFFDYFFSRKPPLLSLGERFDLIKNFFELHPDLDALILPDCDPFLFEMTALKDNLRYFFTGFSGSMGYGLVVSEKKKSLWSHLPPAPHLAWVTVDGRYEEQFQKEASDFAQALPTESFSHLEKLLSLLPKKACVGFFPSRTSCEEENVLLGQVSLKPLDVPLSWLSGQTREAEPLVGIPSLEGFSSRLEQIFAYLQEDEGKSGLLLGSLDEAAWFLGLRCFGQPYSSGLPGLVFVFQRIAFLFLERSHPLAFSQWKQTAKGKQEQVVVVKDFEQMKSFLTAAPEKIFYHPSRISVKDLQQFQSFFSQSVFFPTFVTNSCMEQKSDEDLILIRQDYGRKSRAFSAFLKEVKAQFEGESEKKLAQKLADFFQREGFLGFSFAPIIGFQANGSVIHHSHLSEEQFEGSGLLLIDCGAYGPSGFATDCTRTIWLGEKGARPPSWAQKAYSIVLKSAIQPFLGPYPLDFTSHQLDQKMRQVFRDFQEPVYPHGTGHGIGLHVHERGLGIGKKEEPFRHHSLTSVEPGFYLPGEGGIRLENVALVHVEKELTFENLYEIPYDQDLVDWSFFDEKESNYLKENCEFI